VHPNAQLAAEAAEAADRQGAFWEMHDLLLDHQDALHPRDLMGYADSLGLDTDQFAADLRKHAGATHVGEDLNPPTCPMCPGPQRSSSTASGITAPMT